MEGSHVVDGRTVGIYVHGYTDSLGQEVQEHVQVVQDDGTDLVVLKEKRAVSVAVRVEDAIDLQMVTDIKFVPEPRRPAADFVFRSV
jgi:hypothetical protein